MNPRQESERKWGKGSDDIKTNVLENALWESEKVILVFSFFTYWSEWMRHGQGELKETVLFLFTAHLDLSSLSIFFTLTPRLLDASLDMFG